MKKPPILAVVLVAVALIGFISWRVLGREADRSTLVLQGSVEIRQIALAFEGNGRITAIHADEGDLVKAGEVLGELDTRTLSLQADQAQALIDVQRQVVAKLRAGTRPQEISQARSRVKAAEADVERARGDLGRLQGVVSSTQGRGVSAQDLDHATRAVEVVEARVAEQRENLRLAEVGPRREDIAAAEAQLRAALAQLALLRHQISLGELRAPVDAVVRSRLLEPGDMATPQKPVLALALSHPKWVRVYVSEPDLGRIRTGMKARILTDGQPAVPVDGSVGYISSVAEFTPKSVQTEELRTSLVYEVRIRVEDPGDVLRLGQPATVQLSVGPAN